MAPQKSPGIGRNVVGIIVFDGERFLLLHRLLNWRGWEYPKGGIDSGENKEEAVARELMEETGIAKFEMIGKVDEFSFYDSGRKCNSIMTNFLVRVSSNSKVQLVEKQRIGDNGEKIIEHDNYRWCHPGEAAKLITHKDTRKALLNAIKMLGIQLGE